MSLKIWTVYLISELLTYDLLNVIDKETIPLKNYSSEEQQKRSIQDRKLILQRTDSYYHKHILQVRKPVDIMSKIRDIRKNEASLSANSVRVKVYSLPKIKSESILTFSEKFDAVVQ